MRTSRTLKAMLVVTMVVGLLGAPGTGRAAAGDPIQIRTLSNRADLISGGDALVEVVLPDGVSPGDVTVNVGSRDVTAAFAVRDDGRFLALIDRLRVGVNRVTATVPDGSGAYLDVTNHPIGGPVFSGPQIQPWFCDSETAGLGPATDEQCNAPTIYDFFYKPAGLPPWKDNPGLTGGGDSSVFRPYDPQSPPPAALVATTTTDEGETVPYIVRRERGTIDRGIYNIAVLYDPDKPWTSWSPQSGWNHKLYWRFGGDCSPAHRQGAEDSTSVSSNPSSLSDTGLSRGFMVATSSLTMLANNCNTTVEAEVVMMTKERIAERYGPVRYTMGSGSSGGSIGQHGVANQYPGLLNGLKPTASFPDYWSIGTVNGFDCPLLNNYFDTISPSLWPNPAQRDAVYGYSNGTAFCHQPLGNFRPSIWDPSVGGGGEGDTFATPTSCVPAEQIYDAETNPRGVRCTLQDYLGNILGRRPAERWGPVETKIDRGFANRMLDNVGLQYGLKPLQSGQITPEQFVDLNANVGGWDIDANLGPQRSEADPLALEYMYRSGQIVDGGPELAEVGIIDNRTNYNEDVHDNVQAAFTRERLIHTNGTAANRAEWLEPESTVFGLGTSSELAFVMLDKWLAAVEADKTSAPLSQKVIKNRPAEAADGCFANNERIDAQACSGYTLASDPRLTAGMPMTRDILKCRLKPLQRSDYDVEFTAEQWAGLQKAFPTGVCDWSKPGVGQQPNIPWLTYLAEDGSAIPGGRPLGTAPVSVPFAAADTAAPADQAASDPRLPSTGNAPTAAVAAVAMLAAGLLIRRRQWPRTH